MRAPHRQRWYTERFAPSSGSDPVMRSGFRRFARAARPGRIVRALAYTLALIPTLTDWLETGHLPATPREYITEIVLGIVIALFIAAARRQTARLRMMAEFDSLTGLGNRRKFTQDLRQAVETAHRLGTSLALAYIDLDAFKTINDTFGHGMGDAALQAVARLLRKAARRQLDSCYRIGGDEFALLLIGDGPAGAHEVLQHVHQLRCVAHWNARQCEIKLSCGSVQLLEDESAENFLRRADANMYGAKRARKASSAAYVNEYTLPSRNAASCDGC
jgi:diguanylate cyclase (GGDEF)-like protein